MRVVPAVLLFALLAACAPKEQAPPPAPPGPTLADFAGTWQNASMLDGVADPVPSTMTGTADAATWNMSLQGRDSIAMTVAIFGDSLIGQTAEYESILRKGVMVSVRTASVLKDGGMTGTMVATYKTATGVEVVNGTMTGMRAPPE